MNNKYEKLKKISKDSIISIRCTEEEKNKISNKAIKKGKSVSKYIVDCAIAGLERKSSKEKKRVTSSVKQQQEFNDICDEIKNRTEPFTPEEVMDIIKNFERSARDIWQY